MSEAEFEDSTSDHCEDGSDDSKDSSDGAAVGCGQLIVMFSSSPEGEDPGQLLDFLGEYGSKLRIVGRDDVRGVPTFHGETRVDFRRALEDSFRDDGWSEENIARAVEGHSRQPARVEVWIDGDGLVRRIRTHYEFEPDEDTRLTVPPESEVVDSDEWMRESTKRAQQQLPFEPTFP